jgi:hydrogenase expression/formation protein HypC
MCIAFPGLVVGLDASGAIVETESRRRRASVLLIPEVAVGDWVTVAAGTIVERLEPREAAQIRAILQAGIALELADRPTGAITAQGEGAPDVHPS